MLRDLRWALGVFMVGGCGPAVHYETVEEDAERMCLNRTICEPIPNTSEQTPRCINAVLDESEIGLEEGPRCADSFSELLTCLSFLSCEQFDLEWTGNYAIRDNPVDFPCKHEIAALFRYCDRTWYAINE